MRVIHRAWTLVVSCGKRVLRMLRVLRVLRVLRLARWTSHLEKKRCALSNAVTRMLQQLLLIILGLSYEWSYDARAARHYASSVKRQEHARQPLGETRKRHRRRVASTVHTVGTPPDSMSVCPSLCLCVSWFPHSIAMYGTRDDVLSLPALTPTCHSRALHVPALHRSWSTVSSRLTTTMGRTTMVSRVGIEGAAGGEGGKLKKPSKLKCRFF